MRIRQVFSVAAALIVAVGSPALVAAQDVGAQYQAVLKFLGRRGDFKDNVLRRRSTSSGSTRA